MRIEDIFEETRVNNAAVEAEVGKLEARIARAQQQLEKANARRVGSMDLARRIAEEVGRRMPDRQVRALGPFGLGAEMAIHVEDGKHTVASIALRPGEAGLRVIDPNSESPYAPNTIGHINGLGRRSDPLTGTIDELVATFRAQEAERAAAAA